MSCKPMCHTAVLAALSNKVQRLQPISTVWDVRLNGGGGQDEAEDGDGSGLHFSECLNEWVIKSLCVREVRDV